MACVCLIIATYNIEHVIIINHYSNRKYESNARKIYLKMGKRDESFEYIYDNTNTVETVGNRETWCTRVNRPHPIERVGGEIFFLHLRVISLWKVLRIILIHQKWGEWAMRLLINMLYIRTRMCNFNVFISLYCDTKTCMFLYSLVAAMVPPV